jgi:DNA-binding response OmpR family regulator
MSAYSKVCVRQNLQSIVGHSPVLLQAMSSPELLVVEDDEAIGRTLHQSLEAAGYSVRWVRTGRDALATSGMRLVVLDLGLPDVDGLEVCRQLRARHNNIEILILTARAAEIDVVLGLDAGADDYLGKPFRLAELLARVRARLRREHDGEAQLVAGPITVDVAARRAFAGESELDLRPKEFDLLALLAGEAGRVVRRERIMSDVWDEHWHSSTKTLDVHMAGLRRKLDACGQPDRITTVRGVGYRLETA